MTSINDLLKQREMLDQQIADFRKNEIAGALAKIHALVAEFNLTSADVFPVGKSGAKKASKKVAVKYLDSATGATWTGRGKPPKWIQGQDRAKYLVA